VYSYMVILAKVCSLLVFLEDTSCLPHIVPGICFKFQNTIKLLEDMSKVTVQEFM